MTIARFLALIGLAAFAAFAALTAPAALADGVANPRVTLAPGSYALVVVVEGPRSVALLGKLETRTESWSHVALVHDAAPGAFVATESACAIESDGGLFIARAEPTLLTRLEPWSWPLQVSATGEVTANRGSYALGYRVAPGAEGAAVPARSDDPRVTDPDRDGIPGAAMSVAVRGIGTLRLQVASMWRTALVGRVRDAAAEGSVTATTREEILSGLPIPGRLDPVMVREERSRFRLVPLAAGAGCAAVTELRHREQARNAPTRTRARVTGDG